MIRRFWNPTAVVLIPLMTAFMLGAAGAADTTPSEETELRKTEATIDSEPVSAPAGRVDALSKQFGVEKPVVEQLRGKTGWGGTTIQLAMAENLVKTDPATYPTMTEGLAKIESLRADGKGYGAIAKELGFKLGPVISAAQHARIHGSGAMGMKPAKHEHPPHPAKPPHPEKSHKPEKPPKP